MIKLNLSNAKIRIIWLKKEIKKHDKLYYIKSSPIITDYQYDELRKELEEIEALYPELQSKISVTHTVGTKTQRGFSKIRHEYPMLSLSNAFSQNDITDFLTRIKKLINLDHYNRIKIQCEPKIDGVSFAAHFENGKLQSAATRGDGTIGENITSNIQTIAKFPTQVNYFKKFEVRGEVYMTKEDFLELNKSNIRNNKSTFANPRNAASGSLRQLNSNITKHRRLSYCLWGGKISNTNTHRAMIEKFKDLGFVTNNHTSLLDNCEDIMRYYKKIKLERARLSYDIDGLVYKVDSFKLQNEMGNVSRAPRWAIAHKFPEEYAETIIDDICIQIGRTGAITPVAKLQPIKIGGTIVTKASLHNEAEILRKDIMINDRVSIKRAGDVIPKVIEVIFKKRNSTVKPFVFPKECPICQSKIKTFRDDVVQRCTGGIQCEAQFINRLCHFVSKNALNIEGLSKQLLIQIYKKGLLRLPTDIFRLKDLNAQAKMETWKGWGSKSVDNLFSSIEKSKIIPLDRFIYAFGIRYVGNVTSRIIATHFKNVESLLNCILRDNQMKILGAIKGIGNTIVQSIIEFFSDSYNTKNIKDILNYVQVTSMAEQKIIKNKFKNKTIIFTGTLEKYSRDTIEKIASNMGAKIATYVSRKTDYVVYGQNPGSKLQKANKLSIETISEDKFLSWIGKDED